MDLVRAGIGISKTIKNVGRFREIVTVFAKNGFAEFLESGVAKVTPNFILPKSRTPIEDELSRETTGDIQKVIGKRLRLCFEELGPAFIKIGQLLSSREDIFAASFIEEMKLLQDQVKGIPFEQAKGIIENSLGSPIEKLFSTFNKEPIGKASIGVVYSATLISGEDVVVKVRRPNIQKMIQADMEIFLFLIEQIERVSDEFKYLGLSRIIKDFSKSLETELNFYREAQNCKRLKDILQQYAGHELFYLPVIYDELLTENILVMEKINGIPFSSSRIQSVSGELGEKLEKGIHLFIKTFLTDGFFHADLHGGNFFYMPDGR
jgi:ubiquinone biosynthesis protein